ncbi:hypothetical protein Rmet_5738 (plasmid) [Cupriavidus metallidurans CH34]|uniref:Uncharacterized protein n=2 Tax=Cupriavidus metallidurans TaxID=119219 RepID=Q1LB79_CUPMC|nr:hypothetical protein Rmet_5738 [Cupriavidus metallidurans CH34]
MLNLSSQVERVSCARISRVAFILPVFATLATGCATSSVSAAEISMEQNTELTSEVSAKPVTTDSDADEEARSFQKQLWINPGFISLHFTKIEERNPLNLGFGAEWRFNEDTGVIAGTYVNSVRKQSTYGGVSWQPITLGATQLGAALGVIRGYPKLNHGGWIPMILPTLSYAYGRFGFNLVLVPPLGDKNVGSLSLQLKFKVW